MCIYCGTKKYRKIYEQHYGPIPKDKDNRTYDIHHIDGNRNNNDPVNLKAVSIQEHYDIHYNQGDWNACHRLSKRINLSPEQISFLGKKAQRKRVEDGTHNFLGPENNRRKVLNGTHIFLGPEFNKKRIANGTHIFLNPEFRKKNSERISKRNSETVSNGTHHFLGGEVARKAGQERIKNGTHHFLTNNPGHFAWTCCHCGKSGKGKTNLARFHGDNCKFKSELQEP